MVCFFVCVSPSPFICTFLVVVNSLPYCIVIFVFILAIFQNIPFFSFKGKNYDSTFSCQSFAVLVAHLIIAPLNGTLSHLPGLQFCHAPPFWLLHLFFFPIFNSHLHTLYFCSYRIPFAIYPPSFKCLWPQILPEQLYNSFSPSIVLPWHFYLFHFFLSLCLISTPYHLTIFLLNSPQGSISSIQSYQLSMGGNWGAQEHYFCSSSLN